MTGRNVRWVILATAGALIVVLGMIRSFSPPSEDRADHRQQASAASSSTITTADSKHSGNRSTCVKRPTSTHPRTVQEAFAAIPICAADTGADQYRRSRFGSPWTDHNTTTWGRNGCDTRDDILRRDLTKQTFTSDDHCRPAGILPDPYTGRKIAYSKGPSVQADHVVSLSRAWQTGARFLTSTERVNFANDPLNLLMVDGSTNESKSDETSWSPPNRSFECRYLALQITVVTKYHLWHTPSEHQTIAKQLVSCPTTELPTEPGGRGDR